MKVFGITGGIGMGKTTSGELLRARGISLVDTDVLARHLVEPGQPALEDIRSAFGPGVLASDGSLRRGELARVVFSDPAARRKLEEILHPRIRKLWREQVATWSDAGQPVAVVVIPLLFETQAHLDLDATICVACSEGTQRLRLRERGWDDEQITQRIQAQWPVEKKIAHANFMIWTEGSMEVHTAQLLKLFPEG